MNSHMIRRSAAVGITSVALLAGAAPSALSEVGDGSDPTAVNLRTSFERKTRLAPTIEGTVRAFSNADGPRQVRFTGYARFGIDDSRPLLFPRSTVAKVRLEGTAGTERALRIRLSSTQRAALRRAACRAGRKSVVMNVRISGRAAGRGEDSVGNGFYRIYVR